MTDNAERISNILEVLRGSQVFGVLEIAVLNDLAECLETKMVRSGTIVLREGDAADRMLIVISGRLRVSRRDALGALNLYNEISPGESVGEAGMILHQDRTADVTAVRDSTLAVLHQSTFERLLRRHPLALNRVFAQAIFNHLRHTPQEVERHHAQSFTIIPLNNSAEATELARSLTAAFMQYGRTRLITAPDDQNAGGASDSSDEYDSRSFDSIERHFEFLIYEAEAGASAWTRRAFRQADQVIFVASAEDPSVKGLVEQRLEAEPSYGLMRKHLALLHPTHALNAGSAEKWRLERDFERIYPLRRGNVDDHLRLARFLSGRAVGLVLGGGGARGFAHLGVLRALNENGIPIDVLGGNSMGALIGAQYACGMPLNEIFENTRRFALGGERPTVPVVSLLAGRRIERDLRVMFGETLIEELWQPYFAAACNLSRAVITAQDSGLLWRAVLASNSPAGLMPPVLHKGELLVDGAILDNVPVGAMRQRLGTPLEKRRGNGTIIAVDVDVQRELSVAPEMSHLSVWNGLKGLVKKPATATPGIVDILYRASHIGGLLQRPRTIKLADHYLEPPVGHFPLMGYRNGPEIVELGYRYAMEQIAKWDRMTVRH